VLKWQYSNDGTSWSNIGSTSGSTTLNDVCENGSVTDVAITVSASGSQFNSLLVENDLQVGGTGLYFGGTGLDSDVYMGGVRRFRWQDSNSRIIFDCDILINSSYGFIVDESITTYSNVQSYGNVFIDYNSDMLYSHLYFSGSSASLMWNHVEDQFDFSNDLHVSGSSKISKNIYINADGPDADSYLYFYDGSSETGAYLMWDESEGVHTFGNRAGVNGNAFYINLNGPDGDSYLNFYENSSRAGAYLMWDNTDNRFEFNQDLYIEDVLTLNPIVSGSAPGSPIEGMIYACSDDHKLKYYNGTSWTDLF
jgi:hypothetical protein